MTHTNPAVTLSVRVPVEIRTQLDQLADATGRTKSFLAAEAIMAYLANQAWQIQAIKDAVDHADSDDANFVDHDDVVDWVNGWNDQRAKDDP